MDKAVSDLWWKNAIVYCLDVETFLDADGDGIGDFRGLTRQVEYLAGLGVTCVWLMPFYPSPNRDDGYDVADHYGVDRRLGTLGDVVEFVRTANERGIRVIVDLVVNHTSVEHPWFRSARDRRSPKRDWYVWSEEPLDRPEDIIFPDVEDSNWAHDEESDSYYLHRFYTEQPDLNVANPDVRDEIHRIIGFWMEMGISGFRVDAVPYLIGEAGIWDEMPDQPHEVIREMRAFMGRRRGDAVMVGEVNVEAGERTDYFGTHGEEMTGLFDFLASGSLFHCLTTGEADALAAHLRTMPEIPAANQWFHFIRNHDELNVGRLPDDVRETVLSELSTERSQIYDRGIRRRLPPLVDGDGRLMRLAYSAMLTLPGTPTLLYGEEIGMGDDLSLSGRMAVRTPMQWSGAPNGGFSTADRDRLVRPVVDDEEFGYRRVNVEDQQGDPDSLLSWMERAIRVRKQAPEFGWGHCAVLESGHPSVLAHRCEWLDGAVLAIHNFGSEDAELRLGADVDLDGAKRLLEDGRTADLAADERVAGYGFRWLRLRPRDP